jgi:Stress responsive A/B Barrel Domain
MVDQVTVITHLVLMKPRPDLSAADRETFVAAFERALREIPSIRSVRVGRRIVHGAGYEQTAPDLEYVASIDFDDVAALQAYLRHPAHEELGVRFGTSLSWALVADFEVGGIEALRAGRLLQGE